MVVLLFAAALMLAVAGLPKTIDPDPTRRVAAAAGLPDSRFLVRALGIAEVLAAGAVLVVGGAVPAGVVALTFAAFCLFVTRGMVLGDLDSCGCFNGEDSAPSVIHVVANGCFALAATVAAFSAPPTPSVPELWQDAGAATTTGLLTLSVVVAGLAYLVLARMPQPADPVLELEAAT